MNLSMILPLTFSALLWVLSEEVGYILKCKSEVIICLCQRKLVCILNLSVIEVG